MRRWILVFALGGLVLLLGFPTSAHFASAANYTAASPASRLVLFEMFASPT